MMEMKLVEDIMECLLSNEMRVSTWSVPEHGPGKTSRAKCQVPSLPFLPRRLGKQKDKSESCSDLDLDVILVTTGQYWTGLACLKYNSITIGFVKDYIIALAWVVVHYSSAYVTFDPPRMHGILAPQSAPQKSA